ncbi:MAG: preprotein translocase subunit SecE [Planctomycetaceae bacterium]|nr:preprotein translocase subunit SecE [Planctomycetaceae bacterium]
MLYDAGLFLTNKKVVSVTGIFRELFSIRLYKNSQGRIVRRSTMIGIIAIIAWGAVRFVQTDAGRYVLSWIAWLVSFVTPGIPEGIKPEEVTGLAALPQLLQSVHVLYIVGGIIVLLGIWLAFRIVNMPGSADFLIAVEAEMNKVSWPTSKELYVTTIVVITVMFIFCVFLFVYDFVWQWLFKWMGVL